MKLTKNIFIGLFILVLIAPLVMLETAENAISKNENRTLARFPTLKGGSFRRYLEDRLGFRDQMHDAFVNINDNLFGIMIHSLYETGKEGHTFFKLKPEKENPEYVKSFVKFTKILQDYCSQRDISFLFWLNPRKDTVYFDYLPPEGLTVKHHNITLLKKLLVASDIRSVYSDQTLINAKKTTNVFNKKYDAGHWSEDGAFLGFSVVIEELIKTYPQIPLLSKNDFNISEKINEKIPLSNYIINEPTNSYIPTSSDTILDTTYNAKISLVKQHPYFTHYKNTAKPDAPKILFFCGSFLQGKEKFLFDKFSQVTFIHSYININNFDYYINIFQPDIVVFEAAENVISKNYFPIENIQPTNYQESYKFFSNLVQDTFVQSNDIVSVIKNIFSSEDVLTTIDFDLIDEQISYAYLNIDNSIFDFKINNTGTKQTFSIVLPSNKFKTAQTISLIFINENKTKQQIITVK